MYISVTEVEGFHRNLRDVYRSLTATLQYDISSRIAVARTRTPVPPLSFAFPEAHMQAESCKDIYIFGQFFINFFAGRKVCRNKLKPCFYI